MRANPNPSVEFIDEMEEVPAFDYESRHEPKVASNRPKQIGRTKPNCSIEFRG
jgi:hypothetical protein